MAVMVIVFLLLVAAIVGISISISIVAAATAGIASRGQAPRKLFAREFSLPQHVFATLFLTDPVQQKLVAVLLQLLDGHVEVVFVQDKELELERIQFGDGQTSDLSHASQFSPIPFVAKRSQKIRRDKERKNKKNMYKTSIYLCIAGVGEEDIGKELGGDHDARDDEPVNVEGINT